MGLPVLPGKTHFGISGHPLAKTEGATANTLLIVNECQDQVEAVEWLRLAADQGWLTPVARICAGLAIGGGLLGWAASVRTSRLLLADLTARVIAQGLELLGIRTIEQM